MTVHAAAVLRSARARAGLSRRRLAARAGVPTSTVSRIEDEYSDPTIPMLDRLVDAAGARLVIDAVPLERDPTIAELANAAQRVGRRRRIDWTRLRGFADWAALHPGALAGAIADPPLRTGTPLDAVLAAFAETLADEYGIVRPRWTRAVGPLRREWSPPATPRMRAAARTEAAEPFRRRKLAVARSALIRTTG